MPDVLARHTAAQAAVRVSGEITYQANWAGTQAGSSLVGGNDVAIFNVAAVPEPSIWAMMLLGSGGLLAVQRFRPRSTC